MKHQLAVCGLVLNLIVISSVHAIDCNGNGFDDAEDIASGRSMDCNANSIPDECDIAAGTSPDFNDNGIPDECKDDCNGNGLPDYIDIGLGVSEDCNVNAVPDECDIAGGTSTDCDQDGVPDECGDSTGPAPDCNGNGIPDECDLISGYSRDCNCNLIPDECDITTGLLVDYDQNGVPDICDPDCNDNDIPDFLDIAFHLSADVNQNDVPDECDAGLDLDGDGVPNELDNCLAVPNPCQRDADSDGIGDTCDLGPCAAVITMPSDYDADGIPDLLDNCSAISNPGQQDSDCDGFGDACDPIDSDVDDDGIPDLDDNCVDTPNPLQTDTDGDGLGDACDPTPGGGGGNPPGPSDITAVWAPVNIPASAAECMDEGVSPTLVNARCNDLYLRFPTQFSVLLVLSGEGSNPGLSISGGTFFQHPDGDNGPINGVAGAGCIEFDSFLAMGNGASGASVLISFLFPVDDPPAPGTPGDWGTNVSGLWTSSSFTAVQARQIPSIFSDGAFYLRIARVTSVIPASGVVAVQGEVEVSYQLPGSAQTPTARIMVPNCATCWTRPGTPIDTDGDGVPDSTDNCDTVANPNQADADQDGIGDACDPTPNPPPPGGADLPNLPTPRSPIGGSGSPGYMESKPRRS